MNKKLIIVISVILVVVAGLVVLKYYDFSKTSSDKEIIMNTETEEGESKLQEQAADIIKAKDFSRCDEISDPTYKAVCVNNIALNIAQETGDASYCDRMDNKLVPKEDCERQAVFAKSVENEDIKVCGGATMESVRRDCENGLWQSLAFKRGSIKLCENIKTENERNYCHDNYVLNKRYAGKIDKLNCILLEDIQTREDCKKVKEDVGQACRATQSILFADYCSQNNFRRF